MSSNGHLFVIVHGLWGGPHHVSSIEESIKESLKDHNVYTLLPKGFAFFRTYDGIRNCGNVVLQEIFDKLIELDVEQNVKITKISFVGYSLGGLITRYCIGELMKLPDFFDLIKPVIFTTFATPHLGVRFFDKSIFHFVLNTLGTNLLGQTGKDLFIEDTDKILVKLLEPDGPYYKGLSRFEKRILLSNVRNDRSVPFYTAFVTKYQPFNDWKDIKMKYLKDAPEISINNVSTRPRIVDLQKSTRKHHESSYSLGKLLRFFFILMIVMFVLPFWLPIVFVASCFGTLQSTVRSWFTPAFDIKEKWAQVNTKSKLSISLSSTTSSKDDHPIEEEFAELTGNYVEGVLAANDRLHNEHPVESNETNKTVDDSKMNIFTGLIKYDFAKSLEYVKSNESFFRENNYVDINKLEIDELKKKYPIFDIENIEMNFDQERLQLVENFDSIPFVKIPVYIESFNAHDGLVSRRGVKSTPAGVATILLWCSILKNQLELVSID